MTNKKGLIGKKLKVLNMGLGLFSDSLKEQGVEVVHIDWSPPAGGDTKMIELLSKLENL